MPFYQKLIKFIKLYAVLNVIIVSFSYVSINLYLEDSNATPQLKTHKINSQITSSKSPQSIFKLGEAGSYFSASSSFQFKIDITENTKRIKNSYNTIVKLKFNQYTKSQYKFSHLLHNLVRGPPTTV